MQINSAKFSSACSCQTGNCAEGKQSGELTIALAGNANVGKSAIFNQLTGLNQVTGNWPGKTVERAEGTLHFKGYTIRVVDLPGTYSLSAYSMEEIVSRDYLAVEKPNIIVDVVDASALERNLYLTLQLLELEVPIVMALNQVDFAAKKGLRIDTDKLFKALGVRAVPTVAVTGTGISELLSVVVDEACNQRKTAPIRLTYGKEIEQRVQALEDLVVSKLPQLKEVYPSRWIAIKLLEKDADIVGKAAAAPEGKALLELVDGITAELETVHGETSAVIIASERYALASKIAKEAVTIEAAPRISMEQKLAAVTTHKVLPDSGRCGCGDFRRHLRGRQSAIRCAGFWNDVVAGGFDESPEGSFALFRRRPNRERLGWRSRRGRNHSVAFHRAVLHRPVSAGGQWLPASCRVPDGQRYA